MFHRGQTRNSLPPPSPFQRIYHQSLKVRSSGNEEPGSCGRWLGAFRPSRLQLSPAHEQRQFSRLTLPGSVLGYFHEKGRVARLSWDVPLSPYAYRKRAWPSRRRFMRTEQDNTWYGVEGRKVRHKTPFSCPKALMQTKVGYGT